MDSLLITAVPTQTRRKINTSKSLAISYPDKQTSPVKFAYRNKRPSSSYLTRPNSKGSSTATSTSINLGPGKYNTFTPSLSTSFEFSRSERFNNSDFFAKLFRFKKITDEEKAKISVRIGKNKEEAVKSKEEKIKEANERAVKNSIRAEVTKLTKKQLQAEQKLQKAMHLKEKFRMYEYRTKIKEIAEIKKAWVMLNVIFCIPTHCVQKIKWRKTLKHKATKLNLLLKFIVIFIGKMLRIRTKLKYFKGMRIIRIYLTKYVSLWMKQRRKRNRTKIINFIERRLSQAMLHNLIEKLVARVNFITRSMKLGMFYKISLYESLLNKWNRTEFQVLEDSPARTRRRRRTVSIENLRDQHEGIADIPSEVKIYYIRRFIKNRMKTYMSNYKMYQIQLRSTHRQNLKNRLLHTNSTLAEYPVPPPRPNIYTEFTSEKLYDIIVLALKEREEWTTLICRSKQYGKKRTLKLTRMGIL